MFLYSSNHALSLSTDIISPMTTLDQINYNNHHAELGLFKFLISVYFSQNYENRRKFLGNTYPSAPPPPSPSGFSTPIAFCKRLVITGDGVLVIVAVERAPLTKWKSRIAIVSGVISYYDTALRLRNRSQKNRNGSIYFRFLSWLQSLWSNENWTVGVAGRGGK